MKKRVEIEVVRRTGDEFQEWAVEAIDYESEGDVYVTLFSGPLSERRAREYAEFILRDLPPS